MSSHKVPSTSGIYKITCTTTGKLYIGSSINLHSRWREHCYELRRNKHANQKLQNAWNKYGSDTFLFEIIEFALIPFLIEREQYWLDKLKPFGNKGFNIAPKAGSPLGIKHTPETRAKLSAIRKGQNLGRKHTPEARENMRLAHLGKPSGRAGIPLTPETREKLRQANLGKKQSEETKRKNKESHIGKKQRPESIEKSRLARTGQSVSAEKCTKLSAANAWRMKTLIVTSPEGIEHTIQGIRNFCKEHGLSRSSLMNVAQGKYRQHKGWKARYPETDTH